MKLCGFNPEYKYWCMTRILKIVYSRIFFDEPLHFSRKISNLNY